MANTRAGSVIRVDTTGAITGALKVCGIRYIAGTGTPSANIKSVSTSGNLLWETAVASGEVDSQAAHFSEKDGIYVTLAGTGTVLYIYTK